MVKNIELPNHIDGIENMDLDAIKFSTIAENLFALDELKTLEKKDLNNILNNPKAFMYQLRYQYHLINEKKSDPEKMLKKMQEKLKQVFAQGEKNGYWNKAVGKQNPNNQGFWSLFSKKSTTKLKKEYQAKYDTLFAELIKVPFASDNAFEKHAQQIAAYLNNM